ncbi:MAG: 16S rRNA (cytosine(1402)-N(4))-methyltransferase RsmH [Planctomycetota bacterium]
MEHTPVLVAEVLEHLPDRCELLVDGTLGLGGHARAFLESFPGGQVFGMDRDSEVLVEARSRLEEFGDRVQTAHAPFREVGEHAPDDADAILFDFGVSSVQLDTPERGFSFRHDGPLDMRMDRSQGESAAELLRHIPERELADLLFELGGERGSRRIAKAIVQERRRNRIETTGQLAAIVRRAGGPRGRIDPATRTFQALRMAVNDELGQIQAALESSASLLRPGGRLLAISFHSGEDRIVKEAFRSDPRLTRVTKKPLQASTDERRSNPRARSAKLRVAERKAADA